MPSTNGPAPARTLLAGALVCVAFLPASADAGISRPPLQFFAGRTEMVSVVKVLARQPYRSRTVGSGRIMPDGSLALLQQVFDEGKAPEQRRWNVRQVGPNRYAGSMTEAVGPVVVDNVGGRYRFKFRMKGNLAVEQWLTPLPGGNSARSDATVRKFGLRVATSNGMVRRI